MDDLFEHIKAQQELLVTQGKLIRKQKKLIRLLRTALAQEKEISLRRMKLNPAFPQSDVVRNN